MFGFGKDKKKEEEEAKAQAEKTAQAMRSMSDQLAQKGQEIAKLEDELEAAQKDAAAKAQAEKELAAARAELSRMKAEVARANAETARAKAAVGTATPTGTPGVTKIGPAAPAATPLGGAPAAGGLAVGATAWVQKAGGKNLRLRDNHGLDTNVLAGLPPGTRMTLLEGPVQDDGYPWWKIRTDDGREGWVAGTELVTSPE